MMLAFAIWLPTLVGVALASADPRSRAAVALTSALACLICAALIVAAGETRLVVPWLPQAPLEMALDAQNRALALSVPLIALAIAVYASYHEPADRLGRLLGWLLGFVSGMLLIVTANDLVNLLIGWELVGACSWALIGHRRSERAPGRAAQRAFIITRAGDLGLFIAPVCALAVDGSASFESLHTLPSWAQTVVAWGVLAAATAKAAQLPFSTWLFDAMRGPTSASALLHSATLVAAGPYLLVRLQPFLSTVDGVPTAIAAIGLFTALAGGWVALAQAHAKRLLAASTSAQMGLMFIAIGAGQPLIGLWHLIVHAWVKAPLFLAVGIAREAAGSYALGAMRIGSTLPLVAVLGVVAAVSLAGVPPSAGALTKEAIIASPVHLAPWMAFAALIAGSLSAAYAARFAWLAFGPGSLRRYERPAWQAVWAMAVLVIASVALVPVIESSRALARADGGEATPILAAVSMPALVLGLASGLWIARRGHAMRGASWFGLAQALARVFEHPFAMLAHATTRLDDRLARLVQTAASASTTFGAHLSGADARWLDGQIALGRRAQNTAARQPPGLVAAVVRAQTWTARHLNEHGEALAALLIVGSARLTRLAGSDLRRLHGSAAHRYLAIVTIGAALLAGALSWGH
ncbi:MAG: proton-conducting transporter membrane subunit [Burkholderiaceae bacterium]